MFQNHLKLIIRKLRREKLYAFVNILGLTIGLTAVLLIALYVRDELSFDKFHKNHENISRLIINKEDGTGRNGYIPPDFSDYIIADLPAVESFVRITKPLERDLLSNNNMSLYSNKVYFTDSTFFDFFDFELIDGLPAKVLNTPYTAVITESLASRLFGNQNPIGQYIRLNKEQDIQISGLAIDPPKNSSFQFELLVKAGQSEFENTFDKGYLTSVVTFISTAPNADRTSITQQINALKLKPNYGKVVLGAYQFELLPLKNQRLKSNLNSDYLNNNDISQVYLFSGIGLVILLLAVINYVNLVTAQSLKKSKEIGLRKVIGAENVQLIAYELLESIGYAFLSMVLAFAATERLLSLFNNAIGKGITLNYLSLEFLLFVPMLGISLGLIAGLYPSFYITRFKALSLIQNGGSTASKNGIRKLLATIQFLFAGIMICVTLIMRSQMNYMQNKPIGFKKDLLVNIDMFQDIKEKSEAFRSEVLKIPGINSVSLTSWEFVGYTSTFRYTEKPNHDSNEQVTPYVETTIVEADENIMNTLGLKVLYSQPGFSMKDMTSDEIVVSSLFVEKSGWKNNGIGNYVFEHNGGKKQVVAVIEDFHSNVYKIDLEPTIIEKSKAWGDEQLLVRLESMEHLDALDDVANLYEDQLDRPFEYQFVNDEIDFYYRREAAQMKLFNTFSGLAVFLSLLGLLAMTFYSVEQRRKEVSIRKVLGASVQRLILMLNREYSLLVLVAFIIASPIAYYAMQSWLQEFKYRISLSPLIFIGAFLGFLALSWLVTIAQSLKVSRENPADVLRNE
ncbi:MAG: ABC transporter permease [Cytophagia bacterium]|nr:ABC transporter permease [Cytophagia bacterium]